MSGWHPGPRQWIKTNHSAIVRPGEATHVPTDFLLTPKETQECVVLVRPYFEWTAMAPAFPRNLVMTGGIILFRDKVHRLYVKLNNRASEHECCVSEGTYVGQGTTFAPPQLREFRESEDLERLCRTRQRIRRQAEELRGPDEVKTLASTRECKKTRKEEGDSPSERHQDTGPVLMDRTNEDNVPNGVQSASGDTHRAALFTMIKVHQSRWERNPLQVATTTEMLPHILFPKGHREPGQSWKTVPSIRALLDTGSGLSIGSKPYWESVWNRYPELFHKFEKMGEEEQGQLTIGGIDKHGEGTACTHYMVLRTPFTDRGMEVQLRVALTDGLSWEGARRVPHFPPRLPIGEE